MYLHCRFCKLSNCKNPGVCSSNNFAGIFSSYTEDCYPVNRNTIQHKSNTNTIQHSLKGKMYRFALKLKDKLPESAKIWLWLFLEAAIREIAGHIIGDTRVRLLHGTAHPRCRCHPQPQPQPYPRCQPRTHLYPRPQHR